MYDEQIEHYKIREIRKEGKSFRSDEPSHLKHKKRFYHQES